MTETLYGKEAVFAAHGDNRAITSLSNWKLDAVLDAKFDRDELTLTLAADDIREACLTLKNSGYNFFEDVTCVDWYPNEPRFQVTYHLLSYELNQRVRLVVMIGSIDPSIDSITSVWPAANYYEREVWDLFGVRINGHPGLRRIMMPEEWEGHPLRKDYPVEGYR